MTEEVVTTPQDAKSPRSKWLVVGLLLAAVIVVIGVLVFALVRDDNPDNVQTSDVNGQGGIGPAFAEDAARLERRADGLVVQVEIPTPVPGSYEYPTSDMIPPSAEPHPRVAPGSADAPEVFTLWLFAFNNPARCTDGVCDTDDLGVDADAGGGAYQVDGLIADDDTIVFGGRIRLGQEPVSGSRLENPVGAAVHVAVAAHGRTLRDTDGWRQLNGPVGNPSLWWGASFEPPEEP